MKSCIVRQSEKNYLVMKYKVVNGKGAIHGDVCEKAFFTAWGIRSHMMKTLRAEVKGNVVCFVRRYSDGEKADTFMLDGMEERALELGFSFNRDQVAAAKLPNGPVALKIFSWMVDHFSMIGDMEPAKKYLLTV